MNEDYLWVIAGVESQDAIVKGFSKVTWPGRFEILQSAPPIIVDCAHNRDSVLKLRLTLNEYFPVQAGLPGVRCFGG